MDDRKKKILVSLMMDDEEDEDLLLTSILDVRSESGDIVRARKAEGCFSVLIKKIMIQNFENIFD